MMMMEDIKEEIQEDTGKQLEAFKEETQKCLRELQENNTKQEMELNKTIQDLKREQKQKENPKGDNTGDTNPRKEIRNRRSSISNRIHEMEERISGAEDSIENIDTTIKENAKKILTQNIQEMQDTMRRPNLQITEVVENEDFQLKGQQISSTKLYKKTSQT